MVFDRFDLLLDRFGAQAKELEQFRQRAMPHLDVPGHGTAFGRQSEAAGTFRNSQSRESPACSLQPAPPSSPAGIAAQAAGGTLPRQSHQPLGREKLLPPERVQVLYSWKHSGFNLHAGERVPPEAKADLEDLAQYILRNPFSVEKMTLESPTDMVIYRSRLNAKINRNFEVFTATDFLAAITQHIPDKGAQMVRYYGWYSQQDARGAPARPAAGTGGPPPGRFPAAAGQAPLQALARPDPPRLARGPATLPRLPEPDAGHRRH